MSGRVAGWLTVVALTAALTACWAFGAPPSGPPVAARSHYGATAVPMETAPTAPPPEGSFSATSDGTVPSEPSVLPMEVAITPPPPDVPTAETPPPAAPALPTVTPASAGTDAPEVWAAVIGIDDYPGTRYDLRSAVADAGDVNEALRRYGVPGDHRLVLRNRDAKAGHVRAAADWLVARAGPEDVAVFFFAGHVRKTGPRTETIIGSDGASVVDSELAARFAGLAARRAWFVFAACYGAGFDELVRDGRVLTAAAPANELAYENQALGRSYLVQYMVREAMIERRADGSVQEAFAYARAAIARDYPRREPVQIDEAGTLVDLQVPGHAATPPPASPPSPPPAAAGGSGETSPPATEPPRREGCSRLTLTVVACD